MLLRLPGDSRCDDDRELVGELAAGDLHLLGVNHDQVVTGIGVRGEHGLVLAAQAESEL